MTTPWHVDKSLFVRYADGQLDHVGQAAVETHLVDCADCLALARSLPGDSLEPVWQGVVERVTTPPLPLPLRALAAMGVPSEDVVVLRATVNIQLPWALAVASALVFAVAAGALSTEQQLVAYAVLTPLFPSLLVAASYDATDPLRDLAAATPFSKVRVALLRATLAMAAALPLTVAIGLLVPGLEGRWGAWLLPALALTFGSLTLLTWFSAVVTAATVSAFWLAVVTVWQANDALEAASRPDVQALMAVFALLASVAAAVRLTRAHAQGGPA